MKRRKYNYTPGPNDLCQTPAYAIEPLLLYLDSLKKFVIWECAFGEGYMKTALVNSGYKVIGTDIKNDVDFLDSTICIGDVIVTNPPYSLKKEFTTRCYEIGRPWALLMPADTIGNKWFIELANKYEPKPGIIWMSPRIDFKMPNKKWKGKGAHYNVAWFTWKMGFEGNIYKRMDHWTSKYKEENR